MNKDGIINLNNSINRLLLDGDLKCQLINCKRLITLLEDEVLTLSNAEKLIELNNKLGNMLKTITESNKYNEFIDNENFYTLMVAYLKINKIDSNILDTEEYDFTPEVYSKKDENDLKYFCNDLRYIKRLTPEEEKEIAKKASEGDEEARKKLVESNIRLAMAVARRNYNSKLNLSFTDLVQEGCLGLIRAAEKYDYKKGYKFSTYATWWIMHTIKRGILNKSRTIKIPIELGELYKKISKYRSKTLKLYGFVPSDEAIAEELNVPLYLIKRATSILAPVSLSSVAYSKNNGDDVELLETIPYDKDDYEEVEQKMVNDNLRDFIDKAEITKNERLVIIYKYGMNGLEPLNNATIAKILGLSNERIRQLDARALAKLSKDADIRLLRNIEPLPIEYTKSGSIRKRHYKDRKKKVAE